MRVLVCGTFDCLHPGHRFFLDQAQKKGNELFIIVARDQSVEQIKGRAPVQAEKERLELLSSLYPEAHVVLGSLGGDFLKPVREIKPNVLCLGYDQKLPPGVIEKDIGCKIMRIPAFKPEEYKSSILRKK
ncbi:hypothetical protein A3D11_00065 [Candidatus Peribacteria bacterium RIFCSPHIGHO2_02_FULL_49_16]|nr:MAG: hypothetical protein A2880_02180 [Candidatus Peribacteria bacterium RIFCSPHIGHO2_01_FULL_49_38]OGJ59996.1 MAG: hypothetical protein A3D11_00065 [Candidatus Peribacteria bacterium RIFCSPHIGHO2_02_FULL_49_16]